MRQVLFGTRCQNEFDTIKKYQDGSISKKQLQSTLHSINGKLLSNANVSDKYPVNALDIKPEHLQLLSDLVLIPQFAPTVISLFYVVQNCYLASMEYFAIIHEANRKYLRSLVDSVQIDNAQGDFSHVLHVLSVIHSFAITKQTTLLIAEEIVSISEKIFAPLVNFYKQGLKINQMQDALVHCIETAFKITAIESVSSHNVKKALVAASVFEVLSAIYFDQTSPLQLRRLAVHALASLSVDYGECATLLFIQMSQTFPWQVETETRQWLLKNLVYFSRVDGVTAFEQGLKKGRGKSFNCLRKSYWGLQRSVQKNIYKTIIDLLQSDVLGERIQGLSLMYKRQGSIEKITQWEAIFQVVKGRLSEITNSHEIYMFFKTILQLLKSRPQLRDMIAQGLIENKRQMIYYLEHHSPRMIGMVVSCLRFCLSHRSVVFEHLGDSIAESLLRLMQRQNQIDCVKTATGLLCDMQLKKVVKLVKAQREVLARVLVNDLMTEKYKEFVSVTIGALLQHVSRYRQILIEQGLLSHIRKDLMSVATKQRAIFTLLAVVYPRCCVQVYKSIKMAFWARLMDENPMPDFAACTHESGEINGAQLLVALKDWLNPLLAPKVASVSTPQVESTVTSKHRIKKHMRMLLGTESPEQPHEGRSAALFQGVVVDGSSLVGDHLTKEGSVEELHLGFL